MTLKDLEQIQHNVDNNHIRPLVAEAIKCYESGAYRAALVSLWIAVVADLTSKIRGLAETGDGEAKRLVQELDKALTNQTIHKVQEYERTILSTAEETLQLLLPRERKELERLNEDRNLCAHPGFLNERDLFVPEAELVRTHLVAASRAVFSQRPLAGKRLLMILEQEMSSDSWPSDSEYFLSRFFRQARKSVKNNMVKVLIKHSVQPAEDSERTARRALISALAIANEAPASFEEGLISVLENWENSGALGDSQLIRASGGYGATAAFWRSLPQTAKSRLIQLLTNSETETLVNEGFFICGYFQNEDFHELYDNAVSNLTSEQLDKVLEESTTPNSFIDAIIDHIEDSPTFRLAESNLQRLHDFGGPLTSEDIADLHIAIKSNPWSQVRRAGRSEAILCSIFKQSAPNKATNKEWLKLAQWLHDEGERDDDTEYLYDELLELVTNATRDAAILK